MFEDLKPHIQELRKRLVITLIGFVAVFLVCFAYSQILIDWISAPLSSVLPNGSAIIYTDMPEPIFTALKVSLFAAFIFSLPLIFWQTWLFVAPGLYLHEKRLVIPFVISGTGMFVAGAAFAYYIVFPVGFHYLILFGADYNYTAMPKIGEYVEFFTKLMIAFGITFELPVITFFLAKMGLVTEKSMKSFFRYAIVLIFIIAAILTPPDVISQFLMALPLIVLYGVSIIVAWIVNPSSKEEDNEEEAQEENQ
ncbi:twin-arginine translocase subunit TatC [Helicobacter monodelphidis]|uniref:twin-arginine translocase subunit TatC n=1 Tax=Helicobacter sp. 15-1451 TaxID=2004995 RepID=UPI000DCEEF91|nr:twin-arginine translocase subunit TatC [Helicobacter sp. 15-1451]RAX58375.1 twin-arginine translocase subunit TatC [Helicobacter sp. 15-1451]